jgi:hypothetical protein
MHEGITPGDDWSSDSRANEVGNRDAVCEPCARRTKKTPFLSVRQFACPDGRRVRVLAHTPFLT